MSLDDKVDFLFKKQQGIPFTDPGAAIESSIDAYKRVIPSRQIYAQEIPATAPLTLGGEQLLSGGGKKYQVTGTYSYIWKYVDVPLTAIVSGVSYRYGNGTGTNVLADSIPPLYDLALSYNVTVKVGAATPASNDGTHPWLLDTDAGVLTFMNDRNDNRNGAVSISFWRYEGTKGFGSGSGGAGGVGDASDGQLLYDNSGSVSGSSITYVPSGTATYTYTGSAEKYTGIAVGTKTYADGSRRYVVGRMQQLIPTAQGTQSSRDMSGFYGGVNDFPFFRQPFSDIFYFPAHNIVTKTFNLVGDLNTYILVAIGNRVAWRNASTNNSDADTPWSTYDLPRGEIIYDVVYGASYNPTSEQVLMVVTNSLHYMTIIFSTSGISYSALTAINDRSNIDGQGNSLSGLYYFETSVYVTSGADSAWVPSRVFMVSYKRNVAVSDVNFQKNVSVLKAYCQAIASSISASLTTAANNFYTSIISSPLAFQPSAYGILKILIDSPTDTLPVGKNGSTLVTANVIVSRIFAFYLLPLNPVYSICAIIHSNYYLGNPTTQNFYNWARTEVVNGSSHGLIYTFPDTQSLQNATSQPKMYIQELNASRYTTYLYSKTMIFEPFIVDFGQIISNYPTGIIYPIYPNDIAKYSCPNTVFITAATYNYLLAAETPNVLSFKRYSWGDPSNNFLEGTTAYPTYTSINGVVRYELSAAAAIGLRAISVEAATGSTTIAAVSKATSYNNGTQQSVSSTRSTALKISNQDPYYTVDVNGTLRVQNQSTFFGGYNSTGMPVYPGVINLGFDYGPQIRSIYPSGTYTDVIHLQFLTNAGANDPTLVPRMHIAAQSGNVGIGTTAPGSALDVRSGGIRSYGDVDVIKENNPAVAVNTSLGGSRGGMYLHTGYTPPRLILNTNFNSLPIELQGSQVFISNTPAWKVGVGTDAPLPAAKMHIKSNLGDAEFFANPMPGQLILSPDYTDARLVLGSSYKIGEFEHRGYIQSFLGSNPANLYINPRKGGVSICSAVPLDGISLSIGPRESSWPYSFPTTNLVTGGTTNLQNQAVAIMAYGFIVTNSSYLYFSDIRIKKNIIEINDGDSLAKLRLVEPTSYEYIDARRGNKRVFGFIAQQVREHFPEAVTLNTQTPPNFYQLCDASFNGTYLTLVDISNTETLATITSVSKVRIIDVSGGEHTPRVISVDVSAGSLTFDISGLSITEDTSGGKMFLYGVEVNDFHTLNKDYLYTINFAATQELDREVQRLRADNTALTGRATALETKNTSLMDRVTTLETQNAALQQKLDALLARLGITDL